MVKPAFEVSEDVERLIEFLTNRPRASYAEMSAKIGREVDGRDRYVLTSARRVLEKHGIFFAVERGVGLTRASNGQVARLSTSQPVDKIKRTTRVAQKRQAHVNIQNLTADERLAFDVGRSVLHAVKQNVSRATRTLLAKEILKNDGGVVNINSVLSLPRHRGGR
jgi:hypothetical protein